MVGKGIEGIIPQFQWGQSLIKLVVLAIIMTILHRKTFTI